MAGTLERLTFRGEAPRDALQDETVRLHRERYAYAARFVKGLRVLDLACGAGYGSAILRDAGAVRVVGVDIAPEAVAEARELQARDGVDFFCADYRALGEAAGPGTQAPPELLDEFSQGFDALVSLETIEHMPDPAHFLRTVLAGVRPGGLLIGSVPVTPSVDANPYHLHDFSPASFRRLLRSLGLQEVESMRQRQPFNPAAVRAQMASGERCDLRGSLAGFYLRHPGKLFLRAASTLRHGFVNLYDVVVARKS
jgi:SAM-dependent methyltransferase